MSSEDGVVREVVYLGSVTRFVVELDHGETLVVVRQNLDTSAEEVGEERGRRVRLAWRPQDASPLGGGAATQEEEMDS
jgi:putative spermidine/putrescine transport system ATP-binding protein